MSWTQSASGTAAEVRDAMQGWARRVEQLDREAGETDDVVALHQEHVHRCLEAIAPFLDSAKADYHVAVSIGGHAVAATEDGDDTPTIHREEWYVNLGTSLRV